MLGRQVRNMENTPGGEISVIHKLPSSPVYMSVMKTQDGLPVGIPVWSSFDNRADERTLENEAFSSTLLSLSNKIANLAPDVKEDGKILRLSINNRTFNIYLPHQTDPFQISFVVVFEEFDNIVIENQHREELVRALVDSLKNLNEFRKFIESEQEVQIERRGKLEKQIILTMSEKLFIWDEKRVKYLEKQLQEEREQFEKEMEILRAEVDKLVDLDQDS